MTHKKSADHRIGESAISSVGLRSRQQQVAEMSNAIISNLEMDYAKWLWRSFVPKPGRPFPFELRQRSLGRRIEV